MVKVVVGIIFSLVGAGKVVFLMKAEEGLCALVIKVALG